MDGFLSDTEGIDLLGGKACQFISIGHSNEPLFFSEVADKSGVAGLVIIAAKEIEKLFYVAVCDLVYREDFCLHAAKELRVQRRGFDHPVDGKRPFQHPIQQRRGGCDR
jgi:hypothetical protein